MSFSDLGTLIKALPKTKDGLPLYPGAKIFFAAKDPNICTVSAVYFRRDGDEQPVPWKSEYNPDDSIVARINVVVENCAGSTREYFGRDPELFYGKKENAIKADRINEAKFQIENLDTIIHQTELTIAQLESNIAELYGKRALLEQEAKDGD